MPYVKVRPVSGLGRPTLLEPQALYAGYQRKVLPWDFIGRRRLQAVPATPVYQGFGSSFWDEWSTTTKLVVTGLGSAVVAGVAGYLLGRRRS